MYPRPFKQIDVFSNRPGDGNALAVVIDASHLTDTAMQRFAAWTNLSETTFLLPPTDAARAAGADYRVRIFTPGYELPFAGHPTLGSCHAWLQAGNTPREEGLVVQECGAGLVRIRLQDDGSMAFAAPPLVRGPASPALVPLIASALGLKPSQIRASQMLDNGPIWLGLLLDSAATVRSLRPDHARLKDLGQDVGVIHVTPDAGDDPERPCAVVRAFAAPHGQQRRPRHRQPQCQPGPVADCRGPGPHPLPRVPGRKPGPRRTHPHRARQPGPGLGRRPRGDLYRRHGADVSGPRQPIF